MLKINREKYFQIMKSQGVNAAVTQLHKDTERWEHQTFEGAQGYQPEMFHDLDEVRAFSRELWNIAIFGGPEEK